MAEVFRSRLASGVVPLTQRDPDGMRSGVAEGLQQAGQAIGRIADADADAARQVRASEARIQDEEARRARSRKGAEALTAMATATANVRAWAAENQSKLKLDEYAAKASEYVEGQYKAVRDVLGDDPELQDRFGPLIVERSLDAKGDAAAWVRLTGAKVEATGFESWKGTERNALLSAPVAAVPKLLGQALAAGRAKIDTSDWDPAVKASALADLNDDLVDSALEGALAQGGYQAAEGWLNSGALDGMISPERKENLLKRARTMGEQARVAAERAAEEQTRAAQDAAKQRIAALKAKTDLGIVPNAAELRDARRAAEMAGLDADEQIKLAGLAISTEVARSYGNLVGQPGGADRIRSARDALLARKRAGQLGEDDQVRLTQIEKLVDAADDGELGEIKTLAAKGPQGQLQALGRIGGTAQSRYEKADKVMPGLGVIANVEPYVQAKVLEGRGVRGDAKKEFGTPEQARAAFASVAGPLRGQMGSQVDGIMNAAWDIMAGQLAKRGRSGFDADVYRQAVREMTGATVRSGTNVLQGGIQTVRGKPVWLPSWRTAPEFDALVSRATFKDAVYPSGAPVRKDDVLSNYRPKWTMRDDERGDPIYHMVDANGAALRHKSGAPYRLIDRRPGNGR